MATVWVEIGQTMARFDALREQRNQMLFEACPLVARDKADPLIRLGLQARARWADEECDCWGAMRR